MMAEPNDRFRPLLYVSVLVGMILSFCFGMNDSPPARAQEAWTETPTETTAPTTAPTKTAITTPNPYYTVNLVTLADGTVVEEDIINGPPVPPPGFEIERQAVSLAAYYDRNGYPDIYTGPTNGGVMPLDNSSWPTWSDGDKTYPSLPLSASKKDVDGRTTRGSIDDYWVKDGNGADDPYIMGDWTQHSWGDAIGDYMKTSQSAFQNNDGSTTFYENQIHQDTRLTCDSMASDPRTQADGTLGRKLFYEARGYTVTDCYNQFTDIRNGDPWITGGFSFAQFKAEIDAGRPVMINLAGDTIVGVGYNDSSNLIYIHDTWDYDLHQMDWGGSYSGMVMVSVSIVNLQPNFAPNWWVFLPLILK
ncbi:MAG: hypothetical protein NTV38_04865 [Chloroflexi bacterium]|nr:hypothetical protein [Chloroflexota bacterium]